MGKTGNKKGGGSKSGFVDGSNLGGGLTLRQQIHGGGGNQKNKFGSSSSNSSNRSILKAKHLEKLASWAGGHVSIPSFGALFGQRLASWFESMATPIDSSLFLCQRCESILQPGSNCTVRIETNGTKKKQRKNASVPSQNTVVYTCNFCSHRNLKRGTSKIHMKEILSPRMKQVKCDEKQLNVVKSRADGSKVDLNVEATVCPDNVAGFKEELIDQIRLKSENVIESNKEIGKTAEELVPIPIVESQAKVPEMNYLVCKDVASENSPLSRVPILLLDAKRRKRNRSNNKQVATVSDSKTTDVEKVSGSSTKRRRKSWSSLKELAEANARKNDIANLIIPLRL